LNKEKSPPLAKRTPADARQPMMDAAEYVGLTDIVEILAVEESPLWEVLREIGPRLTASTEAERFSIAVEVVADLLAKRSVELVFTRWTETGVEWRSATAEEVAVILANPRYWYESSRDEEYVELIPARPTNASWRRKSQPSLAGSCP
jgi:hypothetical protein